MNQIKISNFFTSIGLRPNHRGYRFLVYLVALGAGYGNKPFPPLKTLYQQTAQYFNVSADKVEYNVRTVVRGYWLQTDSAKIFTAATHCPVTNDLTVKEFICILSEYVSTHTG